MCCQIEKCKNETKMNIKPTIKTSDSKDLSTNVGQTNFQNYYLAAILVLVVLVVEVVVAVVSYATSILVVTN